MTWAELEDAEKLRLVEHKPSAEWTEEELAFLAKLYGIKHGPLTWEMVK